MGLFYHLIKGKIEPILFTPFLSFEWAPAVSGKANPKVTRFHFRSSLHLLLCKEMRCTSISIQQLEYCNPSPLATFGVGRRDEAYKVYIF